MMTDPKIEQRSEQPSVGIRLEVPWTEFGTVIPQTHDKVFAWLSEHGIAPAGAPFMRYYVINMDGNMDVELGVPVGAPVQGDDQVKGGSIPAGRYATTIYTGIDNGIEATRLLLEWADNKEIVWDQFDSDKGDGFVSRNEFFLTEPADEPDMEKWETEIAIRIADSQS